MDFQFGLSAQPRTPAGYFFSPLFPDFGIPHFQKPSLSITAQIRHLKTRGVDIADETASFLKCVSYYRLRVYWWTFEIDNNQSGCHVFQDDLDFNRIRNLYIFDQKLRILLLEGIERIEVATRALWSNLMAEKYGPHGYLNRGNYSDKTITRKMY